MSRARPDQGGAEARAGVPAVYIAKANRERLGFDGMDKLNAFGQTQTIADLAMPPDQNRIVTFESNRRKKS
jgi:hypothetical protein